jgi:lipid II:glycine glycyltransferase (peptidoglycan interpeptide bridge formation enzyme)
VPSAIRFGRVEDDSSWDRVLGDLPSPHLLQSAPWGDFKSHYAWSPERWAWSGEDGRPLAAAQLLRRRWPSEQRPWLSILYCPRGPAMDWRRTALARRVLADLAKLASRGRTILVKLEPDTVTSAPLEELMQAAGWRRSAQPVQFSSTMVLALRRPDDELLAAMKPKTRYNIRLAEKRGVVVRPGRGEQDLDRLYALYVETSVRDGFVIRPRDYYRRAWEDFTSSGMAQPLLAEVEGEIVAGLIAFRFGRRAWYLYGMSSSAHREAMPNYALQWAAIRWARDLDCDSYDFWGAPDAADPADPLWGLYRFKEGFGAEHVRLVGSWDHAARPLFYWLYSIALPRVLALMRSRQQGRTRRLADPTP